MGLHPRDTARLVRIVRQLRDAGNTVPALVEHEASVMRAADQIIDLVRRRRIGRAGGFSRHLPGDSARAAVANGAIPSRKEAD